jgi:hypothetical protein
MWGRGRLPLVFVVTLAVCGCAAGGLSITGEPVDDGNGGGNGGTGGKGGGGNGGNGGGSGGPGGGGGGGGPAGPRLVAPLSTVTVTSRRPRLRWDMSQATGSASVDLCADSFCYTVIGTATVDGSGAAATPDAELPAGKATFWRVHAGGQTSATWELIAGHRSAPVDNHFGTSLDLDRDGVPDIAAATGSGVAIWVGGAFGFGGVPLVLPNPDGAGANFGYVIAAAGDLNGDGYADLAVGECGGKSAGIVHVYFGGPGGSGVTPTRVQALKSPDNTSGFGCRIAAAGDLDGDGYGDLAVARTGEDFSGGLYIYRGGPNGLPATTTRIDSPDYSPSRLGYSLAGVGDLDGDGYDDLVASEIDASARSGRAHVYRGGPDGISNDRQTTILSPDASGLQFGASVAGIGDVDGDGYPDFAIASPSVSTTPLLPTVHVYRGGTGGIGAPVDLNTNGATGFAGEVEPAGDVDGDGFYDVVVASPSTLTIYRGGAATYIFRDGASVDAAGQGSNPRHLAGPGDLDEDGRGDLLIGDGAGVELFFGSTGGVDRAHVQTVSPDAGASGPVT